MQWYVVSIGLMLATPALAQTIRDKAGNPVGHFQQEGNRTVWRDNAGNPHGYSVRSNDGTIEFRDNQGNLIGTAKPR